jgi:hypoxanthine phosphoribosyltransferase
MEEKLFISPDELLIDSYVLGKRVLDSGFKPDFIVALWRGGTPVGIAVQEFLSYHGVETDHIAVRTSAYEEGDIDCKQKEIRVHNMGYLIDNIESENKLLVVDDVFDTGKSIEAFLETLKSRAKKNTPKDIRIAVVYYKPERNTTGRIPDFYMHETEKWLVFPHELRGLTAEEIRQKKGKVISGLLGLL